MRGNLVLIPVTVGVLPSGQGAGAASNDESSQPALLGLGGSREGWLTAEVEGSTDDALGSLLAALPDGYRDILEFNELTPQAVAFVDETPTGGAVNLIYSVALPSALAELPVGAEAHWVPLVTPVRSFSDARERGSSMINNLPYAREVLDFWRQALEETTAAFAFLPQYFTLRQLREVYNAVWGYDQDFNAFKSWALEKPGSLGSCIHKVGTRVPAFDEGTTFRVDSEGEVIVEVPGDAAVRERMQERLKIARAAALFAGGAAGAAAATVAVPVLAAAGPALALSYVTGAAIHSHVRATNKAGKKPTWYMRTSERPIVSEKLARVYSPRPAWMY